MKFVSILAVLASLVMAGCDGEPAVKDGGGSLEGAGGAGPGYDGSGKGAGKHGTVPKENEQIWTTKTNNPPVSNQQPSRLTNTAPNEPNRQP